MRFSNMNGPLGAMRSITTLGGGSALTTTPTFHQFIPGAEAFQAVVRNFATAAAGQLQFCPWVTVIKTTDSFAAEANLTYASDNLQDGSTATTLSMSSFATSGELWVGSHVPFRGVRFEAGSTNSNTSTSVVTYWSTGGTMATMTATDGTFSGVATMNQTGNVTWTAPTDWFAATLSSIASIGSSIAVPNKNDMLYWVRFKTSAAFDSSVTLTAALGLDQSVAYFEMSSASPELTLAIRRGAGGHAGLEARTDAGTANLIVNVFSSGRFV